MVAMVMIFFMADTHSNKMIKVPIAYMAVTVLILLWWMDMTP